MEGARQSGQVWLPYRPGSVTDFDPIYEATYSRLFATLVTLLHDRGAVEDCVQETYLRAFAAWPRWKPAAPVEAWLHRIAINVVVSSGADSACARLATLCAVLAYLPTPTP